jgi:hypothetical protein
MVYLKEENWLVDNNVFEMKELRNLMIIGA